MRYKAGHQQLNGTYGVTTSDVQYICTTVESIRHALVAHSRVVAIRVLNGLPRLFTGKILAHETMHAWLRLEGYHDSDREVREGLCEVVAHMWLDSQLRSMSKSKTAPSPWFNFQKRLARFLQHEMESRTSYPYGNGFRLVKRATDSYGLQGSLDYMCKTGSFPR